MKRAHKITLVLPSVVVFFIISAVSFFATAAQYEEEVSTEHYLFVKGLVRMVNVEEGTVVVRTKEGTKVSVSVGGDTLFEGFFRLKELEPRQKVKVWYRPEEQGNRALKILKPLELGC